MCSCREKTLEDYQFKLNFTVRDYECDLMGVVNNSVYQNYLEHTRHTFLREIGIDFSVMAERKINLVVVRVELDYKYPLRSNDEFLVGLNMERISKIRFAFQQDIYRLCDNKPIMKAKVIGTALNARGRPQIPKEIEDLLAISDK